MKRPPGPSMAAWLRAPASTHSGRPFLSKRWLVAPQLKTFATAGRNQPLGSLCPYEPREGRMKPVVGSTANQRPGAATTPKNPHHEHASPTRPDPCHDRVAGTGLR